MQGKAPILGVGKWWKTNSVIHRANISVCQAIYLSWDMCITNNKVSQYGMHIRATLYQSQEANTGKTPLTHLGWHLPRPQAMFLPSEFELHFIIKDEMLAVFPYLWFTSINYNMHHDEKIWSKTHRKLWFLTTSVKTPSRPFPHVYTGRNID